MTYLHFHNWVEDEDGALVEKDEDIAITGPVRVQAMTERGFQSFEMGTETTGGLQAVELMEGDVPEEAPVAAKAKASTSSSKSDD